MKDRILHLKGVGSAHPRWSCALCVSYSAMPCVFSAPVGSLVLHGQAEHLDGADQVVPVVVAAREKNDASRGSLPMNGRSVQLQDSKQAKIGG